MPLVDEAAAPTTTPCSCPIAGYCPKHEVNKTPHWHFLCRTRQDYNDAWRAGHGPGQNGRYAPGTAPCVHRGEIVRTEECNLCGGRKVQANVHACPIHGECTITNYGLRVGGGQIKNVGDPLLARCYLCDEREAPADEEEEPEIETRHLLYHVMPWAGRGIWQWNLDQLLRRIDLFNGRRIMGIVMSKDCDSPAAVKSHVHGHGFEFIEARNVKRLREVVTFIPLLEKVESLDPREAVFYAHAKGVTHGEFFGDGSTVRLWAEAMYETCLDDWPAVAVALKDRAMAGSFRRKKSIGWSPWHYSGTYWWYRSKDVYSRANWRDVQQAWFGNEGWPGRVFRYDEVACLFGDRAKNLYDLTYWNRHIDPQLACWREAHAEAVLA